MLKWKHHVAAALFALAVVMCLPEHGNAQGCGPPNPNCIVPTAPNGTNDNRAASTAFVQNAFAGGSSLALASGKLLIGQVSGFAAAETMSGDCTIIASGAIVCTKTNGVALGPFATVAVGAANTLKGSLNGSALADFAIPSCNSANQALEYQTGVGFSCATISASAPVFASRAIAAAQNLTAFTVIQTLGYATAGDGGGAIFKKLAAGVPFQDAYISGLPSITTPGSGLTNGTYLGVAFGNGTGLGCSGSAVVAGSVLSSISIVVPCVGYKVGDVLTIVTSFIGGTGVAPTLTVGAVSSPQASFTDTAANNFQFVTDQPGQANLLQFGCKGDWNGTDGTATNNSPCIWSALAWASLPMGSSAARVVGNAIVAPRGAYMTCGNGWNGTIYNIPISQGVRLTGLNQGTASFVECATDTSSNHYIELCDSNALTGQFGCEVDNLTLNLSQVTTSTGGIAAIYSNSGQQFTLAERMEIIAGARGCVKYEIGKGGASQDTWQDIDCALQQATTNHGFDFNASGTQHIVLHSNIGCAGTGACTLAMGHTAGRLMVDGLDIEAFGTGLSQSVTIAGNQSVYRNVQQNSNNCTQAIQLVPGNIAGNILFENVATGCPKVILNGQSGGTDYNGTIRGALMCASAGACTAAIP